MYRSRIKNGCDKMAAASRCTKDLGGTAVVLTEERQMRRLCLRRGIVLAVLGLTALVQGQKVEGGAALSDPPTLYVVGYAHLDTQWRWDT